MGRDVKMTKAVKTLPTQSFESVRKPSAAEREWEEKTLAPTLRKTPDRDADFTTVSSYPIRRLYTQADLAGWDAERDLGFPGQPPYTRGIHSTMYRGTALDHAPVRRFRHGRRHQRSASVICCRKDRPGFPSRSICRR